ncbi:MAG TPA: 2-phospho-L-lactate transferase CofD family protein, partial [Acidimicrobiia bacterium]|nr:2-phospho-L-lactate transferase CofD family protein [Acidimicrobiia bacterium]
MLAGGTGGAALADGIRLVAPDTELTVIANTADDDEFWGLLVCPDVDAVLYRLAGMFNHQAGYGVRDDTFHVLDALGRIGEDTWFRIGDKDFATHIARRDLMQEGCTLTAAMLELGKRLGVRARVLPMTNDRVRTRFATAAGELSFQEYFVREHLRPQLEGIHFEGIEHAKPSPEVVAALRDAVPGIALSTDIIVGFPGETEEEFQETLSLVEVAAFDDAYTFKYSVRDGTPAVRIKDHVSEELKTERIGRLIEVVRRVAKRKNAGLVGTTHEVLVEGPAKRGDLLQARTRTNKIALLDGPSEWIGTYRQVR